MAKQNKPYKKEQCQFVTPVCLGTFMFLQPGEAVEITSTDTSAAGRSGGGYSYKGEFILDSIPTQGTEQETSLFRAVQTVAWYEDQANYEMHMFGRDGAFKKLNKAEMPKRDLSSYPYALDKYVLNISSTYYPDMLQMPNDLNLADPVQRARYMAAVEAKAPGVVRFLQPSNPADVAKFREDNERLRLLGSPAIPDSEMYKQWRNLQSHEYWSGCYFQVSGEAYWSKRHKNVALSIGQVLFVRPGERLQAGQKSPGQVFTPQMPDPSLAPPPMMPSFPAPPPPPAYLPPQAPPGWAM
jgi:mannose-6-phosphate isomerase-like protein (cupin superfamily)